MKIELFKTLDNIKFYDDIPESFGQPKSIVETKRYNAEIYWPLLTDDFILQINNACNSCIDISDINFFDTSQCKSLINYLSKSMEYKDTPMAEFISDLVQYAHKAIKLNTGIVVEL